MKSGRAGSKIGIAQSSILESISDGVFTVDQASRISSFNRAAELITGVSRDDAIGRRCSDVFRASMCETEHGLSARRDGPFVAVNCGALPDTLLESELFGYKAGAFTGANKNKPGRFALARGGTLLLDEIGEVSPALQVRLLRVLQEKQFEPLGATRTEEANVRVIAATNRDLAVQVESGAFRQDLYYRIKVMKFELPPLRRRREDIPLLVQHFIESFNAVQSKHVTGVSPDVLGVLTAHDYPGNVRELRNIVEHAFVLLSEGPIDLSHLPSDLVPVSRAATLGRSLADATKALEAQAIREALERSGGSRLAAARELGVHKSTLFRKARLLGIVLPEQDGRVHRRQ